MPLFTNRALEEDPLLTPISLMKYSTPYRMGLGSTELPEELSERTVIIALVIYIIMTMAVYIVIFLKLYIFFCQPASKTKKSKTGKKNKSKAAAKSSDSSSASSDDEPASKKESAKRKHVQSKGATRRKVMDVTLDKNGKNPVKTNQVHPYTPSFTKCTIL